MQYFDENNLQKIIDNCLSFISQARDANESNYAANMISSLGSKLKTIRDGSEQFKIDTKAKYESFLSAERNELDKLSRQAIKGSAELSKPVPDQPKRNVPTRSESTSSAKLNQHPISTAPALVSQTQIVPMISKLFDAVAKVTDLAGKKIYVSPSRDFPEIIQQFSRITPAEFLYWTDDMAVPSNGWLFYVEDVVSRLDDEALPAKIRSLSKIWEKRFVFVKLYKEGGTAFQDYRNNVYENTYLPGVNVVKGIYRLRVDNSGMNKASTKDIIDDSELRSKLQSVA